MRVFLAALFIALAPNVARADPPHSRGNPVVSQPINPALESQPVPNARQQPSATKSDNGAKQQQPEPEKLLPAINGIESAIRDLIAEEDKVASQRQEQRAKDDLEAQQDMARWAKYMLWATGAGVFLTGVGIYLIGRTLIYTRDAARHAGSAVEEAKSATKAAQDAVEVTRTIGEAQTRAYLHVLAAAINWRDNAGDEEAWIVVEVVNKGQSPALNCKLGIALRYGDGGTTSVGPPPIPVDLDYEEFAIVGVGDSPTTMVEYQPPDILKILKSTPTEKPILFFEGRVLYEDVFGGECDLEFAFAGENLVVTPDKAILLNPTRGPLVWKNKKRP